MNIKKCSKCGWEFPVTWPGRRCKFCSTPFDSGKCTGCGKYVEKLNRYSGRCKECATKDHRAWAQGRANKADIEFQAWLEKIEAIPKPYATLTEEQWLEACTHFGGCAYCGKPDIDARSMFIPFKLGGRYCAWNIVPSCERCEASYKATENPFKRMDEIRRRDKNRPTKKLGLNLENLKKITEYLEERM